MRRDDIDPRTLVDYALRLDIGRRLGFLLDTFDAGPARELERLQDRLTASYEILDPLLPDEGTFLARWRLKVNIDH